MRIIYDFFETILRGFSWLAITIAAVITLAIAVIGTLDVITTNIISRPVPGAFELSESGLVMLLFFGLAVTSRSGSHIKVDILTNRLPERGQKICEAIGYLITSIVFALWTQQMYFLASKSFSIRETATGLLQFPMYIVTISACLAIMIATVETLRRFLISIVELFKKSPCNERGK